MNPSNINPNGWREYYKQNQDAGSDCDLIACETIKYNLPIIYPTISNITDKPFGQYDIDLVGIIKKPSTVFNSQLSTGDTIYIEAELRMVSGGTDNHLLLLDVTSLDLSGQEAENLLEDIYIFVNKNMIPFDQRKPMDPSGIRLGTPALTTRGLKEKEMEIIADLIINTLKKKKTSEDNKKKVLELMKKFPLYREL